MTELSDLEKQLAEMAEQLIKNAEPGDMVDVFKAVSTWHIAMKKATKGDEPDGGGKFSAIKRAVREAA